MRRFTAVVFAALLLAAPVGAKPGTGGGPTVYWQGKSGGFFVEWTSADLTAKHTDAAGGRVFSFRDEMRAQWSEEIEAKHEIEAEVQLRALVGPYLVLEASDSCDCGGNRPFDSMSARVIDLRAPEKHVTLRDLFPEKDVLAALLADEVVKLALADSPPAKTPKTLDEFFATMSDRKAAIDADCSYRFPDWILGGFSFHHREGGRIAVRIALPNDPDVCPLSFSYLGLWLPVPPALDADLEAASRKTAGVLQRDLGKLLRVQTKLKL